MASIAYTLYRAIETETRQSSLNVSRIKSWFLLLHSDQKHCFSFAETIQYTKGWFTVDTQFVQAIPD